MQNDQENRSSYVRTRFEELNFHDCRLLKINVERGAKAATEDVHLDLQLLVGVNADDWAPARLTFLACASIEANVDFWAKRVCGDAIAETTCEHLSELSSARLEKHPLRDQEQPFDKLLVFSIILCPPGGELRIIARDFVLSEGLA